MTQVLHDYKYGQSGVFIYHRQVMLRSAQDETTIASFVQCTPMQYHIGHIKLTFVGSGATRSIALDGSEIELMRLALAEYDKWQAELAATAET